MKTGIESLDTGAPDITYEGNQGPKSPQEDQRMMQEFQMAQLQEEYEKHVFEMQEQGLEPMSMEQFKDQVMSEGQMSSNQEGIGGMMQDPRTMAADGGVMQLVKENEDGSRPGYRGSDYGDQAKGTGAYSGGTTGGSNFNAGNTGGPADDRGSDRQNYTTAIATGQNPLGLDLDKGPPDLTPQEKEFVKTNASFLDRTKTKLTQGSLNRNKVEAIRKMGLMKKGLPGIYGKIISGITGKVPENLEDLTEEELTELAFEVQKFNDAGGPINQATYNYNLNPTKKGSGSELLGRVFEGQNLLDNDLMTQSKYEELFPGPTVSTGGDGPPIILPYPTTTGMTTADADSEDLGTEFTSQFTSRDLTDADKERISNIGGKSIFLADGGMARERAAFGGIMGDDGRRAYGLGSIFKKAARAIKKVAKSPVGKAALMYFGGNYLQGNPLMGNPFGASNPFKGRITDFLMSSGKLDALKNYDGFGSSIKDKLLLSKDSGYTDFDPFKVGIGGLAALTYFKSKKDQEDEPSLDEYMKSASRGPSINPSGIREYIAANKGRVDPNQYAFLNKDFYAADGGRIGYADGLKVEDEDEDEKGSFRSQALGALYKQLAFGGSAGMPPVTLKSAGIDMQSFGDDESRGMDQGPTMKNQMPIQKPMMDPRMMQMMMAQQGGQKRMMAAMGGRMDYAEGGESEELLDMGGLEKDYRNDGGFVPMGEYERKDDVPARLSKNEFVFTADAVRNAGAGDIDKGAEIMENMMKNLENGGQVSQGSQGLDGAREMFQTQQRLGEVL